MGFLHGSLSQIKSVFLHKFLGASNNRRDVARDDLSFCQLGLFCIFLLALLQLLFVTEPLKLVVSLVIFIATFLAMSYVHGRDGADLARVGCSSMHF